MHTLLPWLVSLSSAVAFDEPEVCANSDDAIPSQVLDAFAGTLDGRVPEEVDAAETDAEVTPTSVRVDDSWAGLVQPELRGDSARAVRRRLGPPALHANDQSGWPVTYGCLVLQTVDGKVTSVITIHLPCSAVLSDPDALTPNSSARW